MNTENGALGIPKWVEDMYAGYCSAVNPLNTLVLRMASSRQVVLEIGNTHVKAGFIEVSSLPLKVNKLIWN